MITLFHHPFCPHSRFVRLALGEYGIVPRLVEERVWERREEFLALNPEGTTPVLVEEGQPAVPGATDHRRISRRDPRRRFRRAPPAAGRPRRARRGAAARRLVPRQVLRRGLRPPGHGTHLQAHHAHRAGRRPAGHRRDPCGAPQHPLSSGLYRLAGAPAELACRRADELCGSRGGRASVGGRLSGRCAVDRGRGRKELVRAGEVAPVVPAAAGRDWCRASRRR